MIFTRQKCRPGRSIALLAIMIQFNSCFTRIKPLAEYQLATFNFSNPFAGCHNPINNNTAPLTYEGQIYVYSTDNNGNSTNEIDFQKWTSNATNPAAVVSISVKLPKKGYFKSDVIYTATQCSTCAETQIGPYTCIQADNGAGTARTAAKPRREGHVTFATYRSTWNVNGARFVQTNADQSCGCLVPYN